MRGSSSPLTRWKSRVVRDQGVLVVAEVARAVVLLTGAGLLVRTVHDLTRVDAGLRSEGVLTINVTLSGERYRDAARRREFVRELLPRLAALPAVVSARQSRWDGHDVPSAAQHVSARRIRCELASARGDRLVWRYRVRGGAAKAGARLRIVLGAQRGDVLRLVVREGMVLAGTRLAIGLIGALTLSRLPSGLPFGVTPADRGTVLVVGALLTGTTLLASNISASRATRIDAAGVLGAGQ